MVRSVIMANFNTIEVKQGVLEYNDKNAAQLRQEMKAAHTFLLNLMGSPGAGKTSTLKATIAALKDEFRIGVMEADIDSEVDAAEIEKTGVNVIQLHTGGMCHMDANMTRTGLRRFGIGDKDLISSRTSAILSARRSLTRVR